MRVLHTSDWHIGRTFHRHSTLDNLRIVLDALVALVRADHVDVVVIAGDVFDSATPAADAYTVLTDALRSIRAAGAQVVVTSGNHDSVVRLGFLAEFLGSAGIHILTRHENHTRPITLTDDHGPVHFYGIPYLEPAMIRHRYPDAVLRSHEQVLGFVMDRIRDDLAARGGRSVVAAHCFAAGVAAQAESSDVERDITSGGLELVPVEVFDGPDYVALGHIHGRAVLSERVRYSGAPLHYSFSEAQKPRGGWLVEIGATGLDAVTWVDLPVPRPLRVLTGAIDDLLTEEVYDDAEQSWVSAHLTDQVRPMDAMRRLQARFPWCATVDHRPAVVQPVTDTTYAERVDKKTDHEIVAGFLELVRGGVGPSAKEHALMAEVIAEVASAAARADAAGSVRSGAAAATESAADPAAADPDAADPDAADGDAAA